jgi:hypothetical protein
VPASSSAASATDFEAPRMPFTSSTVWMCNHIAPTAMAPNQRCHRYILSRPPKRGSKSPERVARVLLHDMSRIDTEPMKRANATLPSSPFASAKASQPAAVAPNIRNGPTQPIPGRGGLGTRGRLSRQSFRQPTRVRRMGTAVLVGTCSTLVVEHVPETQWMGGRRWAHGCAASSCDASRMRTSSRP